MSKRLWYLVAIFRRSNVKDSMDAQAKINARLAEELAVRPQQVAATVELLDGGASVPFISRYRKEVTGGLDDTQLRQLDERLRYCRELEERREAVLAAIDEQGKLDPTLAKQIRDADTKQRLEDLYLPYRKKRRTKAQIAREAGLEPLADALLADPSLDPQQEAQGYLRAAEGDTPAIEDAKAALDGAKQILMERFAEDAELVGRLRERFWEEGELSARLIEGKAEEGAKFSDYFEHDERLAKVPSHRALAMFRGRNEGVLALALKLPGEDEAPYTRPKWLLPARPVFRTMAAQPIAGCARWSAGPGGSSSTPILRPS